MISIRARLFLILLAATGAVWLSAVWWIQHSTRSEVEQVLDARLAEAAQMVSSLLSGRRIDLASAADAATNGRDNASPEYARQLSCQIWSLEGVLVGSSASAPAGRLAEERSGYSENLVDGEPWRVYTEVNEELGLRVMVGDRLAVRERLVADVVRGLLIPALTILPVLAGLIWLSVARGLAPLDRMARALGARSADNLDPVAAGPLPAEIRPMGEALDDLFARVAASRERERSFTAFAAHELKTPLSGIKTQAQIAGMAPDAETRGRALAQIERGVARTDRMVRQLLELAMVDSASEGGASGLDLSVIADDVVLAVDRLAATRGVRVETCLPDLPPVAGDLVLATVALRNVVENAILASPAGGQVHVTGEVLDGALVVRVLDRGAGIGEADRDRITERFFRGRDAPEGGSGLGLSIALSAMARLGGDLGFAPRPGGGEIVSLRFQSRRA
ncbi:ATP-binding protein [Tranquillimonas alkanivorans]|uniref:histidine kinase n=1 Tax=Tranquillimonas alkanivorans TaxID=441119 RepID=A0A1I5UCS4_9RHOB|nr:ATP-binding protein [Tranquillimonas alkanivorans]SFP93032.1 two-component system, OmpR family, sensor histidine kinase QseC [Tranquillimonas alkanivorans]